MTTIAYRNGVIAADRQAYLGRGEPSHARKCKLHRLDDGTVIGLSSAIVGASFQFVRWYEAGRDPESWPKIADMERDSDFEVIAVDPSGKITYWHDSYLPSVVEAEFFAIGSGSQYALGAMAAGAGPEYAVELAARFDPFTGGGTDALTLAFVPGG